MTPEVSDFIPGLLDYTDKHIEVADRHHVMAKQKGQAQIKTCDNNINTLSQHSTTYFGHQIYATNYFPLLR